MPTLNYFDLMLNKAKQHIKNKNFDQASEIILILERNYKNRWPLIYEKIRLELKRTKNYQNALEQFQLLSSSYPDIGIIYLQISKCYLSLNQVEQAIDLYQIAIQQDPELKSLKYNPLQHQQQQQQEVQQENNDFQQKVSLLTQCKYDQYLQNEKEVLFFGYIPLHQYENALTNLQQTIDYFPFDLQWIQHFYQSLCYFKLKKYEKAQEEIDRALQIEQDGLIIDFKKIIQGFAKKQCFSIEELKVFLNSQIPNGFMLFNSEIFSLEMFYILKKIKINISENLIAVVDDSQTKQFVSINPTAYSLHLHYFNQPFQKNKLKSSMIDNLIQQTLPFALGYYIKFNLLIQQNKRDEASLIFDKVKLCNDSYEKYVTMANIMIIKEQFNEALIFIQKAQQIDRYDEESYYLRGYNIPFILLAKVYTKTDQQELLNRDLDYIQTVDVCSGYFTKILVFAWEYIYKFQYYKALNLFKQDHDCFRMYYLKKGFEIINNFYQNKQTNFQLIRNDKIRYNQLEQIDEVMQKTESIQRILQNELLIFLDIEHFYCRELVCNLIQCNQRQYDEHQIKINIMNRYCETLIDLFKLIFTNIEIQPNQLPFADQKSINSQIIELTYHIYQKMCNMNKDKFMKDLKLGLSVLMSKFKENEWEKSMKQELNNIQKDIIQRIESFEYDFYEYTQYLEVIYLEPYFFDGISKLALSDFIKLLGYITLFSDMLDIQQDLSEIIQDHIAYRKFEKVYELAQRQ